MNLTFEDVCQPEIGYVGCAKERALTHCNTLQHTATHCNKHTTNTQHALQHNVYQPEIGFIGRTKERALADGWTSVRELSCVT